MAAPFGVIERRFFVGFVCMAQHRFLPTNVVTFRFAQHGAFTACFVNFVGGQHFTVFPHKTHSYIVCFSHVTKRCRSGFRGGFCNLCRPTPVVVVVVAVVVAAVVVVVA